MIDVEMEGGVYMIGGIALETIYWYTLLICCGVGSSFDYFGDVFDFDGPLDPMLIIPWLTFTSLFSFLGERLTDQSSLFYLLPVEPYRQFWYFCLISIY